MTFVSRRSPWIVPPLPKAEDVPRPTEALPRFLLAAAWRTRAHAVSLAAALGTLPGGEAQRRLLERLGALLEASESACEALRRRGFEQAEDATRILVAKHPLPTCASWAEIAVAEQTHGLALDAAGRDAIQAEEADLAETAKRFGRHGALGADWLAELAADEKNRACLQILVDRWLPSAVRVFGRPGNASEPTLLQARIWSRTSEEALAAFLADTEERMGQLGLWLPDAARMGVVAPEGWKPGRGQA